MESCNTHLRAISQEMVSIYIYTSIHETILMTVCFKHDDAIKWKHFPRYWPFVRGIDRSPGNSPQKKPVTQSFDVFFDLRLNKRLSNQSWGWWFKTPSHPLWRHCNESTAAVYRAHHPIQQAIIWDNALISPCMRHQNQGCWIEPVCLSIKAFSIQSSRRKFLKFIF